MNARRLFVGPAALAALSVGCQTAALTTRGNQVAVAQSAPVDYGWDPASCRQLGLVVGQGGGAFGGGWLPNDDLVAYAMNDLRNKAARRGANYVQYGAPSLGQSGSNGSTTTSTATVTGTAFACERKRDEVGAAAAQSKPACVKGITQACVGPGGCQGGQACLADGSGFGACDCGQPAARP